MAGYFSKAHKTLIDGPEPLDSQEQKRIYLIYLIVNLNELMNCRLSGLRKYYKSHMI